jgi:hypothetical protein
MQKHPADPETVQLTITYARRAIVAKIDNMEKRGATEETPQKIK